MTTARAVRASVLVILTAMAWPVFRTVTCSLRNGFLTARYLSSCSRTRACRRYSFADRPTLCKTQKWWSERTTHVVVAEFLRENHRYAPEHSEHRDTEVVC